MLPLPEEIEEEGGGGQSGQNYGTDINITEEVNRSGVWTSLEGNQNKGGGGGAGKQDKKSLKGRRNKKSKHGGMGTLDEDHDEDEETGGITIKIDKKALKEKDGSNDGTPEEQISLVKNPSDPNV